MRADTGRGRDRIQPYGANARRLVSATTIGAALLACMVLAGPAAGMAPKDADGEIAPIAKARVAPAFVAGELVVGYRDGVGVERRRAIRSGRDASLAQRLAPSKLELVRIPSGEPVRAAARALERRPGVRFAEPNFYRYLGTTPNDRYFGYLWGLENTGQAIALAPGDTAGTAGAAIDAPGAWRTQTGSTSVSVAVVDGGVDYTHPDLAPNIDPRGWDFVDDDDDPMPVGANAYHGTHVAGTIGAKGNNEIGIVGVNWDVSMMPLRVFDDSGRTTVADLVDAYGHAAANGAKVVNGSFGGAGFSAAERNAIASASDTLFAVAAGNAASDNDVNPAYPCNYQLDNVICVAASDSNDELASFSSYGEDSVHLAAPGVRILSTVGSDYGFASGTSMATPHVAGAAALLWAEYPDAPVSEVRARLLYGADPLPSLTGKVVTGGRLNVSRALYRNLSAESPAAEPGVAEARPTTTITKAPARKTKRRRATLRFRASERATFQCRLNRRRWRRCASPMRYRKLSPRRYIFRVKATDLAGNTKRRPTRRVWRVRR